MIDAISNFFGYSGNKTMKSGRAGEKNAQKKGNSSTRKSSRRGTSLPTSTSMESNRGRIRDDTSERRSKRLKPSPVEQLNKRDFEAVETSSDEEGEESTAKLMDTVIGLLKDQNPITEHETVGLPRHLRFSCKLEDSIQNFGGTITEKMSLEREPTKANDPNAIKVHNSQLRQIGYIPTATAGVLASFMDRYGPGYKMFFTCTLAPVSKNLLGEQATMPLNIELGVTSINQELLVELEEHIESEAKSHIIFSCKSGKHARGMTDSHMGMALDQFNALRQPVARKLNLDKVAEIEGLLDNDADRFNNIPMLTSREILSQGLNPTLELKDFQIEGISWMRSRETSDPSILPPFWERKVNPKSGELEYYSEIIDSFFEKAPAHIPGGILWDEQGVGKTLQALGTLMFSKRAPGTEAGTLVVAPVTVITAWQEQIEQHCVGPNKPTYYIYAGCNRNRSVKFLSSFDIVLVSYDTLAAETKAAKFDIIEDEKEEKEAEEEAEDEAEDAETKKKKKLKGKKAKKVKPKKVKSKKLKPKKVIRRSRNGGITGVASWHRVVLDEANVINNRMTKKFWAVQELVGTHKWIMTGTPLKNSTSDLYPYMSFLNVEPLGSSWALFNSMIVSPLRRGEPENSLLLLRAQTKELSLRRTKDVLNDQLKAKAVDVQGLVFDETSKKVYKAIEDSARGIIRSMLAFRDGENVLMRNYSNILEVILRLRQACDSMTMIPQDRIRKSFEIIRRLDEAEQARALAIEMEENGQRVPAHLKKKQIRNLNEALKLLASFSGHEEEATAEANAKSTTSNVGNEDEEEVDSMDLEQDDPLTFLANDYVPMKLKAMVKEMSRLLSADCTQKFVVFSQFTSYLDIVSDILDRDGISTSKIVGTMSLRTRREEMKTFKKANAEGGTQAMLISSKAGGSGITLTEANVVFMLDPLWNEASELQAMDRVHRIGQEKDVRVIRYCMTDTIEEKIFALQAKKATYAKGVVRKLTNEEVKHARLTELKTLFDL